MAPRTAFFALLWLGAGCTFTGLGRYDVTRCDAPKAPTSFDDDPCRVLDDRASECFRYQCDVATGTCQKRVFDFDRDGDPAIACGGHDCDDHDARRTAFRAETCDGVDNDCSGTADEEMVAALGASSLLPLPAGFRDPSLSSSNGHDIVGAVVVDDTAGPCILAFRGNGSALAPPCTFPARAGITPRQPVVRPIVAEDLTFGAAYVTATSTCPKGQIGFRSSKGGAVEGSCMPGGASLPSFLPYPNGEAIVVAYLERPLASPSDPGPDCAMTASVSLNLAWIDRPTATASGQQPSVYSQRMALSASLSTRAPALAPLGDTVLLAAPADGAVGVWSLRAPAQDGSGTSVVPLVAPGILEPLANAHAVAVALDGHPENQRLAIVAEIGCAAAQHIRMVIAELREPGPVVTILRVVDASIAPRAAAPRVAWIAGRNEWWVSWLGEGGALMVRRFNADGLPAGAPLNGAPASGALLAMPNADSPAGPSATLDVIDAQGLIQASVGCH